MYDFIIFFVPHPLQISKYAPGYRALPESYKLDFHRDAYVHVRINKRNQWPM